MTKTFLRVGVLAALCGAAVLTVANAQQPAASNESKPPRFEVASIKRNASGTSENGSVFQSDRYRAFNVRLRDLVAEAYRVRNFQVAGGPPWVSADRFDIEAKAEDPATLAVVFKKDGTHVPSPSDPPFVMLRDLLQQRFKLVVHQETREGPIYVLSMARSDDSRGPQLRPPAVNCGAVDLWNPPPGVDVGLCSGIRRSRGRLMARTATMGQLATSLSFILQRTVLDRTGLSAPFDFDLEWKPIDPNINVTDAATVRDFAPSLVVALEAQLRLKLDSQRGPVDYVVIDSAEPPAEN